VPSALFAATFYPLKVLEKLRQRRQQRSSRRQRKSEFPRNCKLFLSRAPAPAPRSASPLVPSSAPGAGASGSSRGPVSVPRQKPPPKWVSIPKTRPAGSRVCGVLFVPPETPGTSAHWHSRPAIPWSSVLRWLSVQPSRPSSAPTPCPIPWPPPTPFRSLHKVVFMPSHKHFYFNDFYYCAHSLLFIQPRRGSLLGPRWRIEFDSAAVSPQLSPDLRRLSSCACTCWPVPQDLNFIKCLVLLCIQCKNS